MQAIRRGVRKSVVTLFSIDSEARSHLTGDVGNLAESRKIRVHCLFCFSIIFCIVLGLRFFSNLEQNRPKIEAIQITRSAPPLWLIAFLGFALVLIAALYPPTLSLGGASLLVCFGTDLTERFSDQFNPMLVGQNMPWSSLDSTVIRMPLSLECMKDGLDDGFDRIKQIFDRFLKHSSTALLFLKSILQVSLSTWEEGNKHPCQDYSFFIDPSSAVLRNPFSEKKWRKFQISRLFSSSSAAIKMHTIDVNMFHKGTKVVDKWLVVLCLGSGQSRNMALDSQYLAYNLTPVAGVAAHISRNGQPTSALSSTCILSPLPLSGDLPIPVTVIGCFLVCHNGGRYLFKYQDMITSTEAQAAQRDAVYQLIKAWNRELMSCVRDSYIEMVLEIQKLRRDPSNSSIESASVRSVSLILQAYSDRIYLFWPRSNQHLSNQRGDASNPSLLIMFKADWECIISQVIRPFYIRLVRLPVWQLYSGNLVKAEEGMFLAQPGNGVGDSVPPGAVCGFIKEHYPVFSVPWELVTEIQAVGVAVREIRPKMVRDLLRASSSSIVLRSVGTYIDVLEYSLADIKLQESSTSSNIDVSLEHNTLDSVGGSIQESSMVASASNLNMREPPWLSTHSPASSGADALEVVTNFGKALFDFGRGVVEDFGISGVPMVQKNFVSGNGSGSGNADQKFLNIAAELKGLPCPTATRHLARLGVTELWIANKEQQKLMLPLAAKFVHPKCLGRPILDEIFSNQTIQRLMKLQIFSPYLLASHMKLLFSEHWVNHVMNVHKAPWFSWESSTDSSGEGGPSPEWVRLFWKNLSESSGDLSLFSDWPIIPAFLGRPVLCRVREHNMVFIPPVFLGSTTLNVATESTSEGPDMTDSSESELVQSYVLAFEVVKSRHPSLLSLLNQCNIPAYDTAFLECAAPSHCLPMPSQSLGQVIASKLLAAKQAGYFSEPASFTEADRDYLFTLFASDFNSSSGTPYKREELDVLRDLPIYKTVVGSYTKLYSQNQCIISKDSFFQPHDEHCLFYTRDLGGNMLFRALDVPELHDQEILVRFALPGFENKAQSEQEDILIYLYVNWKDLQLDPSVVGVLKETKFVRNADELCLELLKPQDLFDPGDSLLTLVFSGEKMKFPGERFSTDGWLHILRKTGLRTAAEADAIVECARKVESLGGECMKSIENADEFDADFSSQNEIPFEIWSLAGAVLDAIFSNFAVFYSNNFCNTLSNIAFIPAEKGFPSIGGKKGGKRVLSTYNEAILLKDWPLAWSCAPILSRQNVVPPEYSWGAFHLRSPPVFSRVLKHLQVVGRNCGEDTLAHWPMSPGMMTIEGASCEVLKYLDKIWGSLSASDILELLKVAFMPVANGTRLVTANCLFVRLTVNLSPFAFELPTIYLPFVKILKDLGLQDVLSVSCAKDLLMNLQKACGYQRLNPNELRAVMEILHFICNGSVQDNKSDGSCSDVIIPDDGCRLVLASSCVYIDPHGSRYLRSIDTSRLRFVHPYLSEGICIALGIRKLSEVVVEELNHGQKLQFLDEIDSIPLSMVRQKLSSRSFQLAVWTVLNSINSCTPASGQLSLEQIESSLKHIADKLQFVRCLRTSFMLLPKHLDITRATKQSILPEWEDGSGHRTLHFVDQSKNCILVAEPPNYISVLGVISFIVSQVLGSITPLPIGPLFSCPEDLEEVVISTLRLGSERELGTIGGSDRLLGKDLLPQDALQVQFHPLRPFYAGEMVAWRTGKNGEKLKYGRVPLDVRPSAGQALYRLKVETAPGISEPLLSSEVFSFRAISTVSEASPSTLPEGGHTETSSQMHVPVREIAGNGNSELPKLQGAKEFHYGRVSPAELVNAVRDMLSAAGIDMDVEKQSLLQTTLTLQEQIKESQAALLLEQEKADMAAKEAETAKAAWVCRVCLSAEVNVTIVPCGHVLCRRCSSAVSRCPFCRTQASRTMKIFRP